MLHEISSVIDVLYLIHVFGASIAIIAGDVAVGVHANTHIHNHLHTEFNSAFSLYRCSHDAGTADVLDPSRWSSRQRLI